MTLSMKNIYDNVKSLGFEEADLTRVGMKEEYWKYEQDFQVLSLKLSDDLELVINFEDGEETCLGLTKKLSGNLTVEYCSDFVNLERKDTNPKERFTCFYLTVKDQIVEFELCHQSIEVLAKSGLFKNLKILMTNENGKLMEMCKCSAEFDSLKNFTIELPKNLSDQGLLKYFEKNVLVHFD